MRRVLFCVSFVCMLVSFVEGRDELYFVKTPKDVDVILGDPVTLPCEVTPNNGIRYYWELNGSKIANTTRRYQQGSNLEITRVDRERDSGQFTCIAEEDMTTGPSIAITSSPATLNMQFKGNYTGPFLKITQWIIHPSYVKNRQDHNVALAILDPPIEPNPRVTFVKIPTEPLKDLSGVRRECPKMTIMGWSDTSKPLRSLKNSTHLQCADVNMVSTEMCKFRIRSRTVFCLSAIKLAYPWVGRDGGPAMCKGVQYGINSLSGNSRGSPSVWQRVDLNLNFIYKYYTTPTKPETLIKLKESYTQNYNPPYQTMAKNLILGTLPQTMNVQKSTLSLQNSTDIPEITKEDDAVDKSKVNLRLCPVATSKTIFDEINGNFGISGGKKIGKMKRTTEFIPLNTESPNFILPIAFSGGRPQHLTHEDINDDESEIRSSSSSETLAATEFHRPTLPETQNQKNTQSGRPEFPLGDVEMGQFSTTKRDQSSSTTQFHESILTHDILGSGKQFPVKFEEESEQSTSEVKTYEVLSSTTEFDKSVLNHEVSPDGTQTDDDIYLRREEQRTSTMSGSTYEEKLMSTTQNEESEQQSTSQLDEISGSHPQFSKDEDMEDKDNKQQNISELDSLNMTKFHDSNFPIVTDTENKEIEKQSIYKSEALSTPEGTLKIVPSSTTEFLTHDILGGRPQSTSDDEEDEVINQQSTSELKPSSTAEIHENSSAQPQFTKEQDTETKENEEVNTKFHESVITESSSIEFDESQEPSGNRQLLPTGNNKENQQQTTSEIELITTTKLHKSHKISDDRPQILLDDDMTKKQNKQQSINEQHSENLDTPSQFTTIDGINFDNEKQTTFRIQSSSTIQNEQKLAIDNEAENDQRTNSEKEPPSSTNYYKHSSDRLQLSENEDMQDKGIKQSFTDLELSLSTENEQQSTWKGELLYMPEIHEAILTPNILADRIQFPAGEEKVDHSTSESEPFNKKESEQHSTEVESSSTTEVHETVVMHEKPQSSTNDETEDSVSDNPTFPQDEDMEDTESEKQKTSELESPITTKLHESVLIHETVATQEPSILFEQNVQQSTSELEPLGTTESKREGTWLEPSHMTRSEEESTFGVKPSDITEFLETDLTHETTSTRSQVSRKDDMGDTETEHQSTFKLELSSKAKFPEHDGRSELLMNNKEYELQKTSQLEDHSTTESGNLELLDTTGFHKSVSTQESLSSRSPSPIDDNKDKESEEQSIPVELSSQSQFPMNYDKQVQENKHQSTSTLGPSDAKHLQEDNKYQNISKISTTKYELVLPIAFSGGRPQLPKNEDMKDTESEKEKTSELEASITTKLHESVLTHETSDGPQQVPKDEDIEGNTSRQQITSELEQQTMATLQQSMSDIGLMSTTELYESLTHNISRGRIDNPTQESSIPFEQNVQQSTSELELLGTTEIKREDTLLEPSHTTRSEEESTFEVKPSDITEFLESDLTHETTSTRSQVSRKDDMGDTETEHQSTFKLELSSKAKFPEHDGRSEVLMNNKEYELQKTSQLEHHSTIESGNLELLDTTGFHKSVSTQESLSSRSPSPIDDKKYKESEEESIPVELSSQSQFPMNYDNQVQKSKHQSPSKLGPSGAKHLQEDNQYQNISKISTTKYELVLPIAFSGGRPQLPRNEDMKDTESEKEKTSELEAPITTKLDESVLTHETSDGLQQVPKDEDIEGTTSRQQITSELEQQTMAETLQQSMSDIGLMSTTELYESLKHNISRGRIETPTVDETFVIHEISSDRSQLPKNEDMEDQEGKLQTNSKLERSNATNLQGSVGTQESSIPSEQNVQQSTSELELLGTTEIKREDTLLEPSHTTRSEEESSFGVKPSDITEFLKSDLTHETTSTRSQLSRKDDMRDTETEHQSTFKLELSSKAKFSESDGRSEIFMNKEEYELQKTSQLKDHSMTESGDLELLDTTGFHKSVSTQKSLSNRSPSPIDDKKDKESEQQSTCVELSDSQSQFPMNYDNQVQESKHQSTSKLVASGAKHRQEDNKYQNISKISTTKYELVLSIAFSGGRPLFETGFDTEYEEDGYLNNSGSILEGGESEN